MKTIEQLNSFAESLDVQIKEISSYLECCVTKNDLNNSMNKIFSKLSKDINIKINEIYYNVSKEHENDNNSINCILNEDVYTKSEIDNKGFLVEHQSLDNYYTKDYISNNFVKKYDLSEYLKCNCLKQDDLDKKLKSYVTFKNIESLFDGLYKKDDIDRKIDEIKSNIPSIDAFATKTSVKNTQNNILTFVSKNYLTQQVADRRYVSIDEHNSFSNYVDDTYLKISDFASFGFVGEDSIKKFITMDDLEDYALKSSIDNLETTINGISYSSNSLQQSIASLNAKLENNYMKSGEIVKNFITKSESDSKFLSKNTAEKSYLTLKTANKDYLTKREASCTYLAIEDYKAIKSFATINDNYLNDKDGFEHLVASGNCIDGIYIVEGNLYVVKNDKAYQGMDNEFNPLNIYTKSDIDGFNFATQNWVGENFKCKDWIITNEY